MNTHRKHHRENKNRPFSLSGRRITSRFRSVLFKTTAARKSRPGVCTEVRTRNITGFSLTEMLIVVAMFGLTMAAVFSMYQTHTKAAYTEEEVAEVQQNLRVSVDRITHDISMAGFLIPSGDPVANVVNNTGLNGTDTITLNTASASSVSARITTPTQDVTLASGNTINLTVSNLGGFEANDVNTAVVTIIGTQGSVQAVSNTFTVTGVKSTGTCGAVVAPCLTLRADAAGTGTITRGDMIVESGAGPPPNTVAFSVITGGACPAGQNCLGVNGQIIANNISNTATGLQFRYLLDDGTEVDAPAVLSQVRAVRVTLTGQTVITAAYMGGNAKTRTLVSVAKLRNR